MESGSIRILNKIIDSINGVNLITFIKYVVQVIKLNLVKSYSLFIIDDVISDTNS